MVDPRDLGLVDPGPLAAPRGADDLPVRGGAGRDRHVGAPLGTPRRADRRRRPSSSRRCGCDGGCPACTGPAARARTSTRRRSRCGSSRGRARERRSCWHELGSRSSAGSRTIAPRSGRIPVPHGHRPATRPTSGRAAARGGASAAKSSARPLEAVVRCRADDRRPAGRPRGASPGCRASRRRTCRSSASTRRPPGSRRRPGRWRSSSGSAGGRATGSGRSS